MSKFTDNTPMICVFKKKEQITNCKYTETICIRLLLLSEDVSLHHGQFEKLSMWNLREESLKKPTGNPV